MSGEAQLGDGESLQALAIFHGEGAGFWPRVLGRRGFRHCFVALNDGRAWIELDPRGDGLRVSAEVAAAVDLAAHYRALGYAVVVTQPAAATQRYRLPWVFTCVETVKRVLGLLGWWLWTPYQLYRHLETYDHGKPVLAAETDVAAAAAAAAQAGRFRGRSGTPPRAPSGATPARAAGDDPHQRPG
jgi:hypothetical protein